MRRRISVVLLVPVIAAGCFSLSGCLAEGDSSKTLLALATTRSLVESLDRLLESTQKCELCVSAAVDSTQSDLERDEISGSAGDDSASGEPVNSQDAVELGEIAEAWEQRWNLVEEQADLIEERFGHVQASSFAYWSKVAEITAGIRDEELRSRESEKNRVAQEAWIEVHEQAAVQIEKIQELRGKGQDFLRVLQLAAMREDLGKHTEELRTISEAAVGILEELQTLSEDGKSLIDSGAVLRSSSDDAVEDPQTVKSGHATETVI